MVIFITLLILISLNPRPSNFTVPPLPVAMVSDSFWKCGGNSEIPGRLGIFGVHFPANPYFPRKPGWVGMVEGLLCPHPTPSLTEP